MSLSFVVGGFFITFKSILLKYDLTVLIREIQTWPILYTILKLILNEIRRSFLPTPFKIRRRLYFVTRPLYYKGTPDRMDSEATCDILIYL